MKPNLSDKQNTVKSVLITLMPQVVLIGFFAFWLMGNSSAVLPTVFTGLLALLIAFLLIRTSGCFLELMRAGSDSLPDAADVHGKRSLSPTVRHPVLTVILMAALSRIVFFVAVYAIHTAVYGYESGILQMSALWDPPYSQGSSYLNISNSWYAAPGFPTSSYLPLFPLYPALVSGLNLLTGNRFLAGLILSFLCFILSSAALYRLVLNDHGNGCAFRAVWFLCVLPPSFLLNLPAADALYLLLSILTLSFARRRRYFPAVLSAAAGAATALTGVLLIVPVVFELMTDFRNDRSTSVDTGALSGAYIPKMLSAFLIPAVTVFCVTLIERRSGTVFPWFILSAELPNTGFTTVFQNFCTVVQTFFHSFASGSAQALYGYVLPNLICFVAVPLLLLLSVRRIRLSFTVYGIFYYLAAFSFGNLVSAPRYSILCVPVLIGLAACLKHKAWSFLFSILSIVLLSGYLYAFALQWGVF
ncbi:MAG: hypothetical protein II914_01775 [Clostridia bacterium]|nr:hypothetical protein [Clostridia bacterium]